MTYEEQRTLLIDYLKMKVETADWHGVSDAANDLRVLEAAPPIVNSPDRNQAAFDRIAERMERMEAGRSRSYDPAFQGGARPVQVNYPPRNEKVPRDSWWKRLLRMLWKRK